MVGMADSIKRPPPPAPLSPLSLAASQSAAEAQYSTLSPLTQVFFSSLCQSVKSFILIKYVPVCPIHLPHRCSFHNQTVLAVGVSFITIAYLAGELGIDICEVIVKVEMCPHFKIQKL